MDVQELSKLLHPAYRIILRKRFLIFVPVYFVCASIFKKLCRKKIKWTQLRSLGYVPHNFTSRQVDTNTLRLLLLPHFTQWLNEKFGNRQLLGYRPKVDDQLAANYQWLTANQLHEIAESIGRDLDQMLKLEVGWVAQLYHIPDVAHVVAIMMDNCLELLVILLAVLKTRFTALLFHPGMTRSQISRALSSPRPVTTVVFVTSNYLHNFIDLEGIDTKMIVCLEDTVTELGTTPIYSWKSYTKRCAFQSNKEILNPSHDAVAIVAFSSSYVEGKEPKGSKITHDMILDGIYYLHERKLPLRPGDTFLVHLPLQQLDQLMMVLSMLCRGVTVAISSTDTLLDNSGDLNDAPGDLSCVQPQLLVTNPTFLTGLYKDIIYDIVANNSKFYARCFLLAVQLEGYFMSRGIYFPLMKFLFIWPNRKFFSKLKLIMSSGEILVPDIQNFFRGLYGVNVIQYYGCTETASIATMQDCDDYAVNSVGYPFQRIVFSLADFHTWGPHREHPSGSLYLRSKITSPGYYPMPHGASSYDCYCGRWFRTQDVAELLPDGSITIIDYYQNCVFLSEPKPQVIPLGRLEAIFRTSLYVENMTLSLSQRGIVLYIHPSERFVRQIAKLIGIDSTQHFETLYGCLPVRDFISQELSDLALNYGWNKEDIPLHIEMVPTWPTECFGSHQKRNRVGVNVHRHFLEGTTAVPQS